MSTDLSVSRVATLQLYINWYLDLLSLLENKSFQLFFLVWNLLTQPQVKRFHCCLDIIKLHVWKLSIDLSERQAIRNRLRERLQLIRKFSVCLYRGM